MDEKEQIEIDVRDERTNNLSKLMSGNIAKDVDKIINLISKKGVHAESKFVSQDEILQNTNMSKTAALYVLKIFFDYLAERDMIKIVNGKRVFNDRVSIFIDHVKAYKDEYGKEYSSILEDLVTKKLNHNMFFTQSEYLIALMKQANNEMMEDAIKSVFEKIPSSLAIEDKSAEQFNSLSDKLENYLTGEAEREAERRAREDEFLQKMAEIVEMKTANEIQEEIEAARADAEEKEEKNKSLEARIAELEKMMAAKEQESKDQASKIKELESKVEEERGEKEKAISDKEAAISEADKLNQEIKQGLTAISEAANTKGFGSGKAVKVAASMETQRLIRLLDKQ